MTDFAVSITELIKSWILKLPDLSVDSSYLSFMINGMNTIIDFLSKVNYLIPLDSILLILGIVYGFKVLKFTIFGINWVIRRLADFFP